MKSKFIIGSGLTAFIARHVLGPEWQILPFGPSRFYSTGVPAYGDDFIISDKTVMGFMNDLGLNTSPIFFNRPINVAGNLLSNDIYISQYLEKVGIPVDKLTLDYYKTDFTVYGTSCLQLWNKLCGMYKNEVVEFMNGHPNSSGVSKISENEITVSDKDGTNFHLEYTDIISTIPYNVLADMCGLQDTSGFKDVYYYYVQSNSIDIGKADQVLISDQEIPFHKCTRIRNNKFLFEIIGEYIEDIYPIMGLMLGRDFDIDHAHVINNAFVNKSVIDNSKLDELNITCIGSYAECDPLMDVSSSVKKLIRLSDQSSTSINL
jgi:hypothetical protein